MPTITIYWRNDTLNLCPKISSPLSLFVLWLVCDILLFFFSPKLLISYLSFLDKCHTRAFNALIPFSIKSGRVVLRQGHVGQNFYFLFNGSVFVNIDDVDAKGNKFSKTEAVLGRGDSFGV